MKKQHPFQKETEFGWWMGFLGLVLARIFYQGNKLLNKFCDLHYNRIQFRVWGDYLRYSTHLHAFQGHNFGGILLAFVI